MTVHNLPAEDRFARQRLVPGWDQERLTGATAVVCGVGALGNEVAKNLALAGVGRLILCDPDTVSTSNLSRTVLFTTAEKPKVEVAAAALARLAPGTRVDARRRDLQTGVGLGELADADLVFGCLDSIEARLELLGRCALVEARLVDGGTRPWGGELRIRTSTVDPCYGCQLTAAERAASDVPWSCLDDVDNAPAAATIGDTALVAGWMTQAGLRLLTGGELGYRFLSVNVLAGHAGAVEVPKNPLCLHHRPLGQCSSIRATAGDTVADLLAELPVDAEPESWSEFPSPHRGPGPERRTRRLRNAPPAAVLAGLGVAPEEVLPVQLNGGTYRWIRLSR